MSVEEMCHMIELWSYQGDDNISQKYLDRRNKQVDTIQAALRAGQAMRDCVDIHPSIDNDTASGLIRTARAWDAALKEDV
jgi:hypothetical protein